MTETTTEAAHAEREHSKFSNYCFNTTLLVLAIAVMYLIAAVKADIAGDLQVDPFLWTFIVFATVYRLSRLPCAMFYKYTYAQIVPEADDKDGGEKYEPTVSFVIPCMNEEGAIANTITECYHAEYPREKLEVVVINDGSTDNTLKVLLEMKEKYPDLIIVDWKQNRGKRHGMAEGFRRASGDIVVQLDSDSHIERKSFRKIVEPFKNPTVGAVCAHAEPANADKNIWTKSQAAYYFLAFRILKAAESTFHMVLCCSGCSSAYRRKAVLPVLDDFLNQKFLGLPVTWGDDRALTNWMLLQDYKCLYTNQTKAFTIVPDTLKMLFKQQLRWKKGWLVNSLFATKFLHRKSMFVAITHFYPQLLAGVLLPFFWVRVVAKIAGNFNFTTFGFHSTGLALICGIYLLYYRWVGRDNKYWPYFATWIMFAITVLSWLLIYAVLNIQNRKWGTR